MNINEKQRWNFIGVDTIKISAFRTKSRDVLFLKGVFTVTSWLIKYHQAMQLFKKIELSIWYKASKILPGTQW